jgi:hypothetical protein
MRPLTSTLVILGTSIGAACGGDSGTLSVEIWGEEFIEEGIPATAFADGWSVTFARFLVNIGGLEVAQSGETPELREPGFRVYDLAALDGPYRIATEEVPSGRYDDTAYALASATAESAAANAPADAVAQMQASGASLRVAGQATDGADTVTFDWSLTVAANYAACRSTAKVGDGGAATVQLTLHGDHLFYDDAVASEPALCFADLAAADGDDDDDGELTRAEVEGVSLLPLAHDGVGSLDIDNLWQYLEHMITTVGHIDGEGHCHF